MRRFESQRIGASNVVAGLDPATHAFTALNRPRMLLERRNYIPLDFCEPVANVEFVIEARGVDGQARPEVQARRSVSHAGVQLNSHPCKNLDENLRKPKFSSISLAKAELCAIPLSLADRAYGGRLKMKGHDSAPEAVSNTTSDAS